MYATSVKSCYHIAQVTIIILVIVIESCKIKARLLCIVLCSTGSGIQR